MSADSKTSPNKTSDSPWWHQGIRFECQGSGKCCTSHGEYGFVFLTLKDRKRLAKYLGLSTKEFTEKYCERHQGVWHLKERPGQPDCLFLKNKSCQVYEARPSQCRTWPFWPEVMDAKTWSKEVQNFCPGVGKGRLWSREEIQAKLDEEWESELSL